MTCSAHWSTDHSDGYYGLKADCDQREGHPGKHSGYVTTWDGYFEEQPNGVRLEWRPE